MYRPPQKRSDYLLARDRLCRFPGCRGRVEECDIDHVIPFGTEGGITAASNCVCLCRRHHRLKTHGGWHLELGHDGTATWTTPTGTVYCVRPVDQSDSW